MRDIAVQIRDIVGQACTAFAAMPPEEVTFKKSPEEWSKKEILGHLIDSAANNHQRIVRACYNAADTFPPYQQTEWVRIQRYNEQDWETLVVFWRAYNLHLAWLIERMPAQALSAPCSIGKEELVSAEFVIRDYLRHVQHHLKDLLAE